jgi:hypothetical protein
LLEFSWNQFAPTPELDQLTSTWNSNYDFHA